MQPFLQLIFKETYRFMSVWLQTIIGPLTTAVLYQLIFGQQLQNINIGHNISYANFLIPGLVMMQVLLNSFANPSSSIIQSKYTGNIIYVLMAPITPLNIYLAYLIAAVLRGVLVGVAVVIGISYFGLTYPKYWWAVIYFALSGAVITGGIGVIAGILCNKFDQLAGFQSFIMVPLVYLAGIFFDPHTLPGVWHTIALGDPFLYIVDGFRYGFIGYSNHNMLYSAIFLLICAFIINAFGYSLIKNGIKIKN